MEKQEHIDPAYMLSNKEKRYLQIARKMANKNSHEQFSHGAVLVKGGSIISFAFNKNKVSSFASRFRDCERDGFATRHAELSCVLNLNRSQTEGAIIYCVRVGKGGTLRMSKPCDMCLKALQFTGVKKVVYSTGNGYSEIRP